MTNMTRRPGVLIAVTVLALTGCQTPAMGQDVPALITNPTTESRAALQDVINAALNTNVILADDALINSSLLTIERNSPRGMQNPPAQGRNMDAPIQFRLVTSAAGCTLIDLRDSSRYALEFTTCVPE